MAALAAVTLLGLLPSQLASATVFDIVGASKCTWGPSYWCKSIREAKECGANKHCIENYWNRLRIPEDNDDVCTICKNMVKEARDTLNSNMTQVRAINLDSI